MEKRTRLNLKAGEGFSYSLRDFVAIGFRYRWVIVLTFMAILLGAVLFLWLTPKQYEAKIALLLNRDRVDPVVTTIETDQTTRLLAGRVTEQDVNSEVELLRSLDVLTKVVVASGLADTPPQEYYWWSRLFSKTVPDPATSQAGPASDKARAAAIYMAVQALSLKILVVPVIKSSVINVTYRDTDSARAARVLNNLADFYLEKHLEVHQRPGTLEFFQRETERYRGGLTAIETRLSEFGRKEGVVSAQVEKELTLKRLDESEANLKTTRTTIAETEERIRAIEAQLASTPPQLVKSVRSSDNREVVERVKSTLLTLELKRTELLGMFKPSYPAVQEVEKQIAQTEASLAAEEKVLHHEETSDRNPVYESLQGDLAKARSELPALQARAASLAQDVLAYREQGHRLFQTEITQDDLMLAQKVSTESYQLYLRKQEDAQISNALDKQRILNVSKVQKAVAPLIPVYPPSGLLIMLLAGFLATAISLGLAFGLHLLNPSFLSPEEVEESLEIPVLARFPKVAS